MADQELLNAIKEVGYQVDKLDTKLYGENGFEGDIPEIKKHIQRIDGRLEKGDDMLYEHDTCIKVLKDRWKWLKWMIPVGAGGGVTGLGALMKNLFGGG